MQFSQTNRHLRALTTIVIGAVLASCGKSDTRSITAPDSGDLVQVFDVFNPEEGFVSVGKYSGPPGTYTFETTVQGGGDYALLSDGPATSVGTRIFTFDVPINDVTGRIGYAYLPANQQTWGVGVSASVTVAETHIPPGLQVDSIRVVYNGVDQPTTKGPTSVTFNMGFTDIVYVKFFNGGSYTPPPPPPSGKACTPGYWKQSQHFASWIPTTLTTTQLLATQFSNANLYVLKGKSMANYTLLEGLSFKGGSTLAGASEILLRAAIAADLNSRNSNLSYPMTTANVLTSVNAALASGNRDTILSLGVRLDNYNNGSCPLN
jgi:hypothetical protein